MVRFVLLIAIFLFALTYPSALEQLRKNFLAIKPPYRILTVAFLVLVCLSSLFSTGTAAELVFGIPPEYLGVAAWIIFITLPLLLRDLVEQTLSSTILYWLLFGLIIASLITDRFYVLNGMRVSGAMLQATTMGIFTAIVLVLGLYHLSEARTKRPRLLYIITSTIALLALLATQSRVAILGAGLCLLGFVLYFLRSNFSTSLVSGVLLLLLVICPTVFSSYFVRLQPASTRNSVQYRNGLYSSTMSELMKPQGIVGNGSNALPDAINDQTKVPEDVARSLSLGVTFTSTHNLFFDMAYKFGLLGFILLVVLTTVSFFTFAKNMFTKRTPLAVTLFCIFCLLILNALFNVPSIELTLYFFIVLILGLPNVQNVASDSKK